jgi:hypothetical protein
MLTDANEFELPLFLRHPRKLHDWLPYCLMG